MKKTSMSLLLGLCLLWVLTGCVTGDKQGDFGGIDLEQAIAESAALFIDRLPEERTIAILGIEAPTRACAEFIQQELWQQFQGSGKFRMADQQNTDRIQQQLRWQAGGYVSEETVQELGKAYGPQTIVYGKLVNRGSTARPLYRLNLFSTAVEAGTSEQASKTLNPRDPLLMNLLEPGDLDARIENAITEMASRLDQQLLIGIDRISYEDTGTVTGLSSFLEKQIQLSASRLYTRYKVADERVSREYAVKSLNPSWVDTSPQAIKAMVKGSYYLDKGNNVQVILHLISTAAGKEQLGACKFTISEGEIKQQGLSTLPSNYTSRDNYREVQGILSNFDTSRNSFIFSAHPSRPDGMYYDGDSITFSLYAAEDCYFLVQILQADGVLKDMYPTETWENNHIKAGETRNLPDTSDIKLGEPFGEEYVLFTAYKEQFVITHESTKISMALNFRGATKNARPSGSPTRPRDQNLHPVARAIFRYTLSPK